MNQDEAMFSGIGYHVLEKDCHLTTNDGDLLQHKRDDNIFRFVHNKQINKIGILIRVICINRHDNYDHEKNNDNDLFPLIYGFDEEDIAINNPKIKAHSIYKKEHF